MFWFSSRAACLRSCGHLRVPPNPERAPPWPEHRSGHFKGHCRHGCWLHGVWRSHLKGVAIMRPVLWFVCDLQTSAWGLMASVPSHPLGWTLPSAPVTCEPSAITQHQEDVSTPPGVETCFPLCHQRGLSPGLALSQKYISRKSRRPQTAPWHVSGS